MASAFFKCTESMLTRAFAVLKAEFETQVLIWNSLSRSTPSGATALGVLVPGSREAHVHSVVLSWLAAADADPAAAARLMESAGDLPEWDGEVCSLALAGAIRGVIKVRQACVVLEALPNHILGTGRSVLESVHNRTTEEKLELLALIVAVPLEAEDLLHLRKASHLPHHEPRVTKQQETVQHGDQDRATSRRRVQSPLQNWKGVKVKVKNTFLELDLSDKDDDQFFDFSGSSVRSSSVPSRSTASRCSSDSEFTYR